MSTHFHQTIRALEQDLEVKQGECADIERALIPLRRMAGLPEDGAPPAPVKRVYKRRGAGARRGRKIKTAKKNDRQTDRAKRGPTSQAPRSLPDDDAITQRILEQLHKRSPMSPADLTAAVKADKVVVRARVKALEAAGQVTTSGVTMSRLIHLANAKASPAPPKPNGSMKPAAAVPSSTLSEVEERDRNVLMRVKGSGAGGRSIRELMIVSGETEGALVSAIDRLRIKRQIRDDGNGKWVSV